MSGTQLQIKSEENLSQNIFAEETVRSDRNTPYDYAMCTGRMFAKQLTRDEVKDYPLANTKPQYLTRDRRIEIMSNLPREILQNCAKYIQ